MVYKHSLFVADLKPDSSTCSGKAVKQGSQVLGCVSDQSSIISKEQTNDSYVGYYRSGLEPLHIEQATVEASMQVYPKRVFLESIKQEATEVRY